MKLTDINLTVAQMAALLDILNERAARMEAEKVELAESLRRDAQAAQDIERLIELARRTAQIIGPVPGVAATRMGETTWAQFIAHEGAFSRFDVRQYYDPAGDADYWIDAYEFAIREIEAGVLPRLTYAEARRLPWEPSRD